VDNYFQAAVVAELDGRVGHISQLDRARDRERDNELTAAGFRVLHFTWLDIVGRPGWVVATLRTALAAVAA
jgi:very-short-patch-repair endonuclease